MDELRQHLLRQPMALISPTILTPDGSVFFAGSRLLLDSGRIRGTRGTSATVIRRTRAHAGVADRGVPGGARRPAARDRWARRGLLHVLEDVDLSHRATAAGGELVVREDLVAIHDTGGTQGPRRGRAKSALYYRYNCRNRLLFAARPAPVRDPQVDVGDPAVSWEILLRGGRRQLVTQPGLAFAALRGSLSGLASAAVALRRGRRQDRPAGSVLAVHPGTELYGSDRMFVESVAGLAVRVPSSPSCPDRAPWRPSSPTSARRSSSVPCRCSGRVHCGHAGSPCWRVRSSPGCCPPGGSCAATGPAGCTW